MIMTNGLIIHGYPTVLEQIKEAEIDKIYMSYHFNLHSVVSPVPKEIILDNIIRCNEKNIKPRILTTLSTSNYDKVLKMCYTAYMIGAKGIAFTNYIYLGKASENELDLTLTQEMIDIALKQIDMARKLFSKEEFLIERCGSFGSSYCSNHFDCHAGLDNVSITPDNKVYMCNFLIRPELEIGVLENGTIFIDKDVEHDRTDCIVKKLNYMRR